MGNQKLRLVIDDLRIETFETAEDTRGRGTVRAHEIATATAIGQGGCECGTRRFNTCGPVYDTLYLTCGDPTCYVAPDGQIITC